MIRPLLILLLSLTAFGQPSPINRRAFALTSIIQSDCGSAIYPTNVNGLMMWLQGDGNVYKDLGTTPAANFDRVEQWNDSGTNGNNVINTTLVNRPMYKTGILNGKPVVEFGMTNTANTFLFINNTTVWPGPATILMVIRFVFKDIGLDYVFAYNGGLGSPGRAELAYNTQLTFTDGAFQAFNDNLNSDTNRMVNSGIRLTNVWYRETLVYDDPFLWRSNGVGITISGTNRLSGQVKQMWIGTSSTGGGPSGNFQLAEIIWFTNHVALSDIEGMECYLKHKWGL